MMEGPTHIARVPVDDANSEPGDAISPTTIVHQVDDFRAIDAQGFYNFLDYTFVRDGLEIKARAYLHTIDDAMVLSIAPPSTESEARLMDDVVAYMKRRYERVRLMHEEADRG
jgi:hypothetical protein